MPTEESVSATTHLTYPELPSEDAPALLDKNNAYRVDCELYLVYDGKLWRRTGLTHNARTIALADAVGWEGDLLEVVVNGAIIELQHRTAGVEHRIHASERTKWCFVTFEEAEKL